MSDTTRVGSAPGRWPAPDAPLPPNPAIRVATLANGLTCWIRRHPRPAGSVSFCLRVGTGSLDEEEHERGISHLLEHMAFRGSANFPPGAVQRLFAAAGTRIGRNQNASTGLDHTSFRLAIPAADDRTVDTFLLCLADFAHRLTLAPEELARERRVVLEELRAYPRSEAELRETIMALLLPGSLLAARRPLGTKETLTALTAAHLRRHYERWYRPENATLLVVGDVDEGRMAELASGHFGGWAPAGPPAVREDPVVRPLEAPRAAVIGRPDAAEAEVRTAAVLPEAPLRTVTDFRARLVERMAVWLVNREIDNRTREGNAGFRDARVGLSSLVRACTLSRASASGPRAGIGAMLEGLALELRRAGVHPPASAALAGAKEAFLTAARQAVVSEGNRSAESLVAEMEEALGDGRTPVAANAVLELAESFVPGIAPEEVREAAARTLLRPARLVVAVVPGDPSVAGCDADDLLRALTRAGGRRVAAPASRTAPRRLLGRGPRPGRAETVAEDDDTGVLSATLENGTRVHLREMGYRKGRVFVTVTLAGGRLCEGPESLGATSAAALAWSEPATSRHSSLAIRDHLSGKALAFETRVEEDTVEIRLAADPVHLEDGLRLIHLLLTRPRVEASAFRRWRERSREAAQAGAHSLEVALAQRSLALLSGGDPRFALPSAASVAALTRAAAQRWLDEVVRPAPLEAALVGDAPRERMMDLALRYLGSLPARPRRRDELDALRALPPLRGPRTASVTVDTPGAAAAVLVGWRAAPWSAARDRHLLQLAEQVLLERVRAELREERGMSYSPEVAFTPSRAYPAASLLSASTYTAPEAADETAGILRQVVARLAADGPTPAEMDTVRRQFGDLLAEAQRDPKYWCRVLADLDYRGARLEEITGLPRFFAACTAAAVREAVARVATDARRIGVTCRPSGGRLPPA